MLARYVFAKIFSGRVLKVAAALVLTGLVASSTPLPPSSMKSLKINSKALGGKLPVMVYVPQATPPTGGWPVLYLLHGLGGCERDWVELGEIQVTLDRLIATGRIRPMMVVMPGAANSWYVDSGTVGGPGDYETAIIEDLPRAIQKRFPVAVSPRSRAIAGVSMGGYGALRLALKHPEMFGAVASMSGAIWQNLPVALANGAGKPYDAFRDAAYFRRPDAATVVPGIDLPPEGEHFDGAFGEPFDAGRFNRQNVFTLLASQIAKGTTLPAIYLTVGDHDSHNLWRGSIALYQTLQADRQKVEFRVTDGDHTWSLWRKSIEDTLLFVDQRFAVPAAQAQAETGGKAS
ncbi:alpha/beta hydrolase [Labrys wisconsinensis]|uniref:Enterochelin esterase family protein n=1 Tax=Labrys wisconsinensis TaxID=425677 RepID=A0ABU0JIR2_9HYPH|nr:alpha/beta hydrolase family protein [Labrys wisconsinensis]MDQ0474139.1 enterochelin esterase family protein [Labrys wisconsinensis]